MGGSAIHNTRRQPAGCHVQSTKASDNDKLKLKQNWQKLNLESWI